VLPLIELSDGVAVAVSVVAWLVLGFAVGYGAHRLALSRLDHDGRLTRLASFEQDGRWYERRLRIRRWKDRLPEAGGLFAGGFSQRALRDRRRDTLERFVAETRRAELTHWVLLFMAPLFFLWNPAWLAAAMVLYALAANVPCLLVQRYNRARLLRILRRNPAPSTRVPKVTPPAERPLRQAS